MNLVDAVADGDRASRMSLFNLAFRVFFLAAAIFSMVSVSLWAAAYVYGLPLHIEYISMSQWHAHEMIYGYSMAVIAGFILTAAKTWTGIQTLYGKPLMLLFGLWACARVLFFAGTALLGYAAILDMLFMVLLIGCAAYPVLKARQWHQMAVISKLLLLAVFNLLFYLGAAGVIEPGVHWGIYGGLYLVIGLILTMGRRVLPFFIERGVGYPVKLYNARWMDISSMVLFLGFFINELFIHHRTMGADMALALFLVNAIRLAGWHTPGIWHKSLLWSLYLAFWFICIGFLLYFSSVYFPVSPFLAIHAFAVGGVGVITLAMMSRVSLGHTGRNVRTPPRAVSWALGLLLAAAVARVFPPLVDAGHFLFWVGLSQILWVCAFAVFTVVYYSILTRPRTDGRFG